MRTSPEFTLLLVRLGFGLFIIIWGANKFFNPGATAGIFAAFYGLPNLAATMSFTLGLLQVAIGLMIVCGLYKTFSYAVGVLIHGSSTLATLGHLLQPFAEGSNLLFWAAVPVLLSALGLFLARDADTLLSLDALRRKASNGSGRQLGFGPRS
jgi:uncharacterized membrane protein YphA (DoxX/SURF4 family)